MESKQPQRKRSFSGPPVAPSNDPSGVGVCSNNIKTNNNVCANGTGGGGGGGYGQSCTVPTVAIHTVNVGANCVALNTYLNNTANSHSNNYSANRPVPLQPSRVRPPYYGASHTIGRPGLDIRRASDQLPEDPNRLRPSTAAMASLGIADHSSSGAGAGHVMPGRYVRKGYLASFL